MWWWCPCPPACSCSYAVVSVSMYLNDVQYRHRGESGVELGWDVLYRNNAICMYPQICSAPPCWTLMLILHQWCNFLLSHDYALRVSWDPWDSRTIHRLGSLPQCLLIGSQHSLKDLNPLLFFSRHWYHPIGVLSISSLILVSVWLLT